MSALLAEARRALPGTALVGLIDPDLPPLDDAAALAVDDLCRNAYAGSAWAPRCFVALAPERDHLFVARLLSDDGLPCLGLARPAAAGLEGALDRYWRTFVDEVPAAELWERVARVEPRAVATRQSAGEDFSCLTLLMPGLEPTLDLTNTPETADRLPLLRRFGADVRVVDSCLLAAYADDPARVQALAAAELGRAVSADEVQQWTLGIARPPALFLAEAVAAARTVTVHSAWLAAEIAARYGRVATLAPAERGVPRIRAHAAGLAVECCHEAVELLDFWGIRVELSVEPHESRPAHLVLFLAMRGQASFSRALRAAAHSGLRCIASLSVAEAVDLPSPIRLVPDQPSPLLLAEAIRDTLDLPAAGRATAPVARPRTRSAVYVDLSKLVAEPRRSGIQRVERELIRHWPGRPALIPCRFDPAAHTLRVLPSDVLDILARDGPAGGMAEERRLLAPFLAAAGEAIPDEAEVFCAELFDDVGRAAYHQARQKPPHWLVFDFLPWLHPEWFPAGPANRLMAFLRTLRAVRPAFISAATQRDFAERVMRRPCDGPVLPLGADGLGLERQRFDPARRDIVMLGTIEARKNAMAALEAFRALWREGSPTRLVLIGAVEQDALAEQALLRELAGETRLVQLGAQPDAVVREALRGARAVLFPSEGEGYGLPPMEALHAGIPVIVAEHLPALAGLPPEGQIRLANPDAPSIAQALRQVRDDPAAEGLWRGAAVLSLPTWRDFAASVADWISDAARDPAPG